MVNGKRTGFQYYMRKGWTKYSKSSKSFAKTYEELVDKLTVKKD